MSKTTLCVRTMLASLTAALLLAAACYDSHANSSLSGGTFPPLAGATVAVEDLTSFSSAPVANTPLQTQATDALGSFNFGLGHQESFILLQTSGGTFFEPATLTQSALPGSGGFSALLQLFDGEKLAGVYVSPLSHIAAVMGESMTLNTAQPELFAIQGANNGVSTYFSDSGAIVQNTRGAVLWNAAAPVTTTTLTDDVILGLVTAALDERAGLMSTSQTAYTLTAYTSLIAADAADGTVDGVLHPPFLSDPSQQAASVTVTGYSATALSDQLATDITTFINSTANHSNVTAAMAAPLTNRIRAEGGRIFPNTPHVDQVQSPASHGSTTVTINGSGFAQGASVFFGAVRSAVVNVRNLSSIQAALPDAIPSGQQLYVTVINPSGLRHSLFTTITRP